MMTKLADAAIIAAAIVLLYKLLTSGQQQAQEPARLQKVRATGGFVYDYGIDGYSRVLPDGSKEYLL